MGNKYTSTVTSGVREQASGETKKLYKFMDLKGGGELVDLMKMANRTKNYTQLDERIRNGLKEFLYAEEGKIVHIRELIAARCKDKGILTPRHSINNNFVVNGMQAMTGHVDDEEYLNKHGKSLYLTSLYLTAFISDPIISELPHISDHLYIWPHYNCFPLYI